MVKLIFYLLFMLSFSNNCKEEKTVATRNPNNINVDTCKNYFLQPLLNKFTKIDLPFTVETYFKYHDRLSKKEAKLITNHSSSDDYDYQLGILANKRKYNIISILKTNIEDDFESTEILVSIDSCGNKISEMVIGRCSDKYITKWVLTNDSVSTIEAHLLYEGLLRDSKCNASIVKKDYFISSTGLFNLKKESKPQIKMLYRSNEHKEFLID
jgi:hypothetical protein